MSTATTSIEALHWPENISTINLEMCDKELLKTGTAYHLESNSQPKLYEYVQLTGNNTGRIFDVAMTYERAILTLRNYSNGTSGLGFDIRTGEYFILKRTRTYQQAEFISFCINAHIFLKYKEKDEMFANSLFHNGLGDTPFIKNHYYWEKNYPVSLSDFISRNSKLKVIDIGVLSLALNLMHNAQKPDNKPFGFFHGEITIDNIVVDEQQPPGTRLRYINYTGEDMILLAEKKKEKHIRKGQQKDIWELGIVAVKILNHCEEFDSKKMEKYSRKIILKGQTQSKRSLKRRINKFNTAISVEQTNPNFEKCLNVISDIRRWLTLNPKKRILMSGQT